VIAALGSRSVENVTNTVMTAHKKLRIATAGNSNWWMHFVQSAEVLVAVYHTSLLWWWRSLLMTGRAPGGRRRHLTAWVRY
jgi:protein involved in ribonucleotide reduction